MVPAVSQDPETGLMFGVPVRLNIRMMTPGEGEVFVNTRALTQMDMQGSARVAAMVAGDITGKHIDRTDFLITLYANSTIIGGPSAGASITVGMVSLLEDLPMRNDVMMTGMIGPDGVVGVVGGIPEKASAAAACGMDHFLIPEGQAISYNSTTYEDVNVTKMAAERWNLTVIEVHQVREAVSWYTGMEFKARKYPSLPVAVESYQELMRSQSSKEITQAKITLQDANYSLQSSGLNTSLRNYLGNELDNAAGRLQAAEVSFNQTKYYVASSKAFQSKISTRFVSNYVTFLSLPPENRSSYTNSLWEGVEEMIAMIRENITGFEVQSITGLECLAATQSRIHEATELLGNSRSSFSDGDHESSIYYVSFARERIYTAILWSDIIRFYGNGHPTEDDDLKTMAENIYADASILATYADLLYEEIFGLPHGSAIDFIVAFFPQYSFIDPYESLNAAQWAMTSNNWSMAAFEALESEVRSGLAIDFINILVLSQDEGQAKRMLGEMINRSRKQGRLAIMDSRNIGIEPVLSVSRFEFSGDLAKNNETYSLGEAAFGFRYSGSAARISSSLLSLYLPLLEVENMNGTLITTNSSISGLAEDPNGDPLKLEISIGDIQETHDIGAGPFNFTFPSGGVQDGPHILEINLTDGNLFDSSVFQVCVDNNPPDLLIREPTNGTLYSSPVGLNISVTDNVDDQPELDIYLDGAIFTGQEIGEGRHSLRILAVDEVGWRSREKIGFLVDSTPPLPELLAPDLKNPILPSLEDVYWRVDENLSGIHSSSIRINEHDWKPGSMVNRTQNGPQERIVYRQDFDLPQGRHMLSIRAVDRAGNNQTTIHQMILDSSPPLIEVDNLRNGSSYNHSFVISYHVNDLVDPSPDVESLLDGVPYGQEAVGSGDHEFFIKVTDFAGNTRQIHIYFSVDTEPPLISHNLSQEFQRRPVRIDFRTRDLMDPNPDMRVLLDGDPYYGRVLGPGIYDFHGVATDNAGNSATLDLHLVVDNSAPVVTCSVENRTWYKEPSIITIDFFDDMDPSPGYNITLDSRTYEPPITVEEGKHALNIQAWDWAANRVQLNFYFHVDETRPDIEVNIDPGQSFGKWIIPRVNITDNLDPSPLSEFILDGNPYEMGQKVKDGNHTISIRARDKANNSRQKKLRFYIDTKAPTIELDVEDGGTYVGSLTPNLSVHDEGAVIFNAYLDGEPYEKGSSIGPGVHTLEVRAEDELGNEIKKKVVFEVKRRIPIWVLIPVVGLIFLAAIIYKVRGSNRDKKETEHHVYSFD